MSGIEVAGIVLAVIPLIIAGFESYDETRSKLRSIQRYQQELRCVNRALRAEHQIFRNTVERLLRSCLDDQSMDSLLQNVGGPEWSDAGAEKVLKLRLGDSHRICVETIDDVRRNVELLRRCLGVDSATSTQAANSMQHVGAKLSFAFRKSSYLDIVAGISKSNVQLEKLVDHVPAFVLPAQSVHSCKANIEVQRHAKRLYLVMQQALCQSCKAIHAASLHMNGTSAKAEDSAVGFRVVLHHLHPTKITSANTDMTWSVEEAEIRLVSSVASEGRPAQLLTSGRRDRHAMERSRSRSDSATTNAASQSRTQVAQSTTAVFDHQRAQPVIDDLCVSMQRLQQMRSGICLGYLTDGASQPCHALYWPSKRIVEEKPEGSTTLMAVLSQKDGRGRPLSVRESRQLAMHLAAGALQFSNTPWLGDRWSKEDITLFESKGRILAEHPFITATLQRQTSTSASYGIGFVQRSIRNKTLCWLGIMLIELCLGKPIEQLQTPEEAAWRGAEIERCYLAADRLLTEGLIFDTAGERYDKAVRRCVYCLFESRSTDLSDAIFHQTVEAGVLDLLKRDVDVLFPGMQRD